MSVEKSNECWKYMMPLYDYSDSSLFDLQLYLKAELTLWEKVE